MTSMLIGWLVVLSAAFHAPLGGASTQAAATQPQVPSAKPDEPSVMTPPATPPSRKDPFGRLFRDPNIPQTPPEWHQPQAAPHVRPQDAGETPKPRVVCGLRIIPLDPSVDPKMRIPVPDTGVDFKIRRLNPPVCTD
jgi:hypothetical protein